jgi:hypothetical protein
MNIRVMVVAGTVEEFHQYLQEKKSSSTVYTFVDGPNKFTGMTKETLHGVFIGTWYNRPDIQDIAGAISIIKGGLPMQVVDKLHEIQVQRVQTIKPVSTFTTLPVSNGGTITANEYWSKQGFLPGQNKTNLEVYDEVFKKLNSLSSLVNPNEVKDYINDTINNQEK